MWGLPLSNIRPFRLPLKPSVLGAFLYSINPLPDLASRAKQASSINTLIAHSAYIYFYTHFSVHLFTETKEP